MSVKDTLLQVLEENRGTFLSGELLAERLSVTRSAVWKAIHSLEQEGYEIQGVPNRGYTLSPGNNILSPAGIRKYLPASLSSLPITVHASIDSTNTALKNLAISQAPHGTIIAALEQTNGRGRLGRSFYSPSSTGVYFSLLLRPASLPLPMVPLLTTAAATAAADGIDLVTGKKSGIKWVNDIWMGSKKVCGILSEASLSMENGGIDFVVIGIGINLFPPKTGFPKDLSSIASCLFPDGAQPDDVSNRLVGEILSRFFHYYDSLSQRSFLTSYEKRLFFIGQEILVAGPNNSRPAIALGIDQDCHLKVRYLDTQTEDYLSAGEISIRFPSNTAS